MKKGFLKQKISYVLEFLLLITFYIINIQTIELENLEGINTNTRNGHKRCGHRKSNHQKNFYYGHDKRIINFAPEIKFEKFRIHFDYTYTLKYEEKIIKELIMPPVKKLLENSLKVRRFPEKIRFPRNVNECEGVPVPNYLKSEGVDSDLIILVSTQRGVKKHKYEQAMMNKEAGVENKISLQKSSMIDYFKHKMKKPKSINNSQNINNDLNSKSRPNLQNRMMNKNNNTTSEFFRDKKNSSTASEFKTSTSEREKNQIKSEGIKNSKSFSKSTLLAPEKLPWEINESNSQILGWSYMCVQDVFTLRPIAGVMQYVADIELTPKMIEEAIWTTLHEITHVLVMDYDLFPDFIDNDFTKKGYTKTIKVKTRLKYLDKILEERHHLMNNYLEFARFQRNNLEKEFKKEADLSVNNKTEKLEDISSCNNIELNEINENSINQDNSYDDDVFEIKLDNRLNSEISGEDDFFYNIDTSKDRYYTTNEFLKGNMDYMSIDNFRKRKHEKTDDKLEITLVSDNSINKSSSNRDKIKLRKSLEKEFSISTNTKLNNNTNLFSNSNQPLFINGNNSESITNNTTKARISNKKVNVNIDEIFNTGSYEEPTIKLPLVDEFYDVTIHPEFNITTLATYIENFIENTIVYLATPKVLEMARTHFGCDSLDGVELEHFGGLGSAYSHWSKRILNTEFLIADTYGEYYVSNISLALFEDSGWYKVDYSKSDTLLWGKGKGCGFLNDKCVVKKESANPFIVTSEKNSSNSPKLDNIFVYDTNYKDEFCISMDEEICSISNTFRATCGLRLNQEKISKNYQYFDNPLLYAPSSFGDYCPYPVEWVDNDSNAVGSCKYGKQIRKELGEKVCENCRCFRSSLIEEKFYNINKDARIKSPFNRYKDVRAACYEARCRENSSGKIELVVYINEDEVVCPKGGGVLSVDGYNGFIKCPKLEIICDGMMDAKANFSKTSGYLLVADLPNKILKFYNEYFDISFYK